MKRRALTQHLPVVYGVGIGFLALTAVAFFMMPDPDSPLHQAVRYFSAKSDVKSDRVEAQDGVMVHDTKPDPTPPSVSYASPQGAPEPASLLLMTPAAILLLQRRRR